MEEPKPAAAAGEPGVGTDSTLSRFEVRRKLGEGGMGVVYEAYDRELRTNVALKTVHRFGPGQLYRLKQEFRALCDLSHRNLVTLYELFLVGNVCYISMELIEEARSILEHIRPVDVAVAARAGLDLTPAPSQDVPTQTVHSQGLETATAHSIADAPMTAMTSDSDAAQQQLTATHAGPLANAPVPLGGAGPESQSFRRLKSALVGGSPASWSRLLGTTLEMDRLRPALRQLCRGVHTLHRMGKIHRDLKPRNVLVAKDHRVVICDFGLVTEIREENEGKGEGRVEGTLAYMAPEQARGERLTFATDWFAVGVMLYEALTARRPFPHGDVHQLREAHRSGLQTTPRELVPGLPEDLDQLCCDLLAVAPEARPSGAEILARLGETAPSVRARAAARPLDRPLVGRSSQLSALWEAYEATLKGKSVVQFVRGDPGVGKSALVARFLDEVPSEVAEDVVILAARCYASESVPYNAIDGLIDALSGYLKELPPQALEELLPSGVAELARLFPVLQRVDAISSLTASRPRRVNEHEKRRHAFAALAAIFRRLAADRSLLLCIDDFQHCDKDSARLLVHLLDSHPPIPMLLVACEKHQDRGSSWFTRQLGRRKQQGTWSGDVELREIALGPLSVPQSRAFAQMLIGSDEAFDVLDRTVKESAGNPLYIEELAAAWARRRARSATLGPAERDDDLKKYAAQMKIESVLLEPTHGLTDDARRLLRIAAVAGRPTPQGILYQAAELGDRRRQAATTLRTSRLVRVEGLRETDRIEIAHDGLRAAVLSTLSPRVIETLHRRLATSMLAVQSQDHQALAEHWLGANEPVRAREAAVEAADRAAHALAFDRASHLYRMALDLRQPNAEQQDRELRCRLAEALASAGHGLEAATAFLSVARGGSAADAIEYRRRAAELYFQCGCVDEGITVLYEAMDYYGMHLARSDARAIASLLWLRLRLRLKRFRYHERDESEVAEIEHKRSDLCASVLLMLGMINGVLGAQLQAHNLLRSLDVGEPKRLARAASLEPIYMGTRGDEASGWEVRSAEFATDLAEKSGDPSTIAFVTGAAALRHHLRLRFASACELSDRAIELQQTDAVASSFEGNTVRLVNLWTLYYLGRVNDFVERVRSLVQDAEARGDSFMFANLCAGLPNASWLLVDDVNGARWSSAEAVRAWPTRADRHIQGYWEAFAVAQTDLYTEEKGLAWKQLEQVWETLVNGAFMRSRLVRAEAWHMRGRCAIDAAAAGTREQPAMMRAARRAVRALMRKRTPVSAAWARMIKAGMRSIEGERRAAIELLAEAEETFSELDMLLYVMAAQWRRGELQRGDAGRELVKAASRWMFEQGVANPRALVGCLAPGFPRSA